MERNRGEKGILEQNETTVREMGKASNKDLCWAKIGLRKHDGAMQYAERNARYWEYIPLLF